LNKGELKDEQARQLTTPKARHGHVAILSAQVWHEIACMVGEEKQETRRNIMKIYITLENGKKRYYANKLEAKRNAKKATKFYEENQGESDHSSEDIEVGEIPTTKSELIEWLNENAYYTGWFSGE
jgi:RecA/RadA recombinase